MAMGVPIIGADSGAIPDILEGGTLGTLTPYGDAPALAEAIITTLSDPAFAQLKAENAQARVRELYSPEMLAAQVMDVYSSVMPAPFTT